MGFRSLQHMKDSRSTSRGPKPTRYVPPSGFGYPLGGLLPRIPGRFCFAPAALLGFTLRRFPSRKESAAFQPGRTHLPLAQRLFRRRSVRPARRASVSGFAPFENALRSHGLLGRRPPAPPLGFRPSRATQREPRPELLRASPHTLRGLTRSLAQPTGAPGYHSALASPRPIMHRSARRPEQPFWGFCTSLLLSIWEPPTSGLSSSPHAGPRITADSPAISGRRWHPAEAVQDQSWVPSIANDLDRQAGVASAACRAGRA
jgi:hypothetical protein